LFDYVIWEEPRGIGRWKEVTTDLVEYQASLSGKTGPDRDMFLSEGMYQQLLRVISECPEAQAAQMKRDFIPFNQQIKLAVASKQPITSLMYQVAFDGFYTHLYEWLQEHSYLTTFGKSIASTKSKEGAKIPSSGTPPTVRQMTTDPVGAPTPRPPSTAGSIQTPTPHPTQGRGGPPKGGPGAPWRLKPPPPGLASIAPTGKARTWSWVQGTFPKTGPRHGCNEAPPPECDNPQCEYLGDWLDWKGRCSYCTEPDHVKENCTLYKANVQKFRVRQGQENSNSPAQ
jgi:hypothetical protein